MKSRKNNKGQITIKDEDGKILREKMTPRRKKHLENKLPAKKAKQDQMFDLVLRGKSIRSIAKALKIEVSQIYKWYAMDEKFKDRMDMMRKARGFYFENEIHELLKETTKKSQVPVAKLKLDGYSRLAKWNNPDRFGEKRTNDGNTGRPIQIIFNTGIDRTPIDVESTTTEIIKKDD